MSAVVVAGVSPEAREVIVSALSDSDTSVVEREAGGEPIHLPDEDVDLVVLGERVAEPVREAQQIGAQMEKVPILIVVTPERAEDVARALRYALLHGGEVRWVSTDHPEEISERVRAMTLKSQRRRRFTSVLPRIREKMPRPRGQDRSTLYLDTLLDYAPMGVVLLDLSGTIVDMNPEAARYLADEESLVPGRRLVEVLPASVREHFDERLLEMPTADQRSVSRRLPWTAEEEEATYVEVTVARIAGGSESAGMLVMLRDVTADVHAERTEAELHEQRAVAHALEQQADELRRLNRELEARNEELQQFAYVASHDLQEPLRKIASFSDLLIEDAAHELGEQGRFYVDRMQAAALRMSELIRSILRFSRVRTDEHDIRRVDLNEVVGRAIADLSLSIDETGTEIIVGDLPHVEGDLGQLSQLFQNLISNSIKFRNPDAEPRIRIAAQASANEPPHDGMVSITVSDNGIGFDDKYADRIFSPFQRLHPGGDHPGTGMGLAICKRIVEGHGGTIDVASRPGEGAAFTIHLPKASAEPLEPPPEDDR